MEQYNYSSLTIENNQIRLLYLSPGVRGSPVSGWLTSRFLREDDLRYTALSYTWGSLNKPQSITIETSKVSKCSLAVTTSLHEALDHIRDEADPVVLWIDAVCIDQENIPERNHQVRLMRRIYARATNVHVWLGPATDDSDIAIQTIKRLIELNWSRHTLDWRDRQALEHLFHRSWWYRIWVRQEIHSTQPMRCEFQCGDTKVSYEVMERFLSGVGTFASTSDTYVLGDVDEWTILCTTAPVAISLVNLKPFNPEKPLDPGGSIEFWLHQSRWAQASDPRDHIFAILSLTSAQEAAEEFIDYAKNVAWVFASIIILCISRSRSLQCLSWVSNAVPTTHLPSWTCDWSQRGKHGIVPLPQSLFRASRNSCADCMVTDDRRQLRLLGLEIGAIQEINKSVKADYAVPDIAHHFTSNELCLQQYGGPQKVVEALWRTQLVDTMPPVKSHEMVQRWPKGHEGAAIYWRCLTVTLNNNESVSNELDVSRDHRRLVMPIWTPCRQIVISSAGHICLVPEDAMIGDAIRIFAGGNVPLIIRPNIPPDSQTFVGDGYVHGIMDGEAWNPEKLQYTEKA